MSSNQETYELRPWIDVRPSTGNQLVGLEAFYESMAEIGSVHVRKVWRPSAFTGAELWLVVKWGVGSLASIWASGKIYDAMRVLEKKLIASLKSLCDANQGNIELNSFSLEYDDMTINFSLLPGSEIANVGKFVSELPEQLEFLRKKGVDNIDRISLPVCGEELANLQEQHPELAEIGDEDYFRLWKIRCDYGCNCCYYDSRLRRIY